MPVSRRESRIQDTELRNDVFSVLRRDSIENRNKVHKAGKREDRPTPVAPGMRRGPMAVPRDRSQGLAAPGFFHSFMKIAFLTNDPRLACSEAGHSQCGRRT